MHWEQAGRLVRVHQLFTRQQMVNWDPAFAHTLTFLELGRVVLRLSTGGDTRGWAVGFGREGWMWFHPHVTQEIRPIHTGIASMKRGQSYHVDVRNASSLGAWAMLHHVGSCVEYAVLQVGRQGFWDCMVEAAAIEDEREGSPGNLICGCWHGRHRSRMIAKALAGWTRGLYHGHHREGDGYCPAGCLLLGAQDYVIGLQQCLAGSGM